jgi:hypothetical protein
MRVPAQQAEPTTKRKDLLSANGASSLPAWGNAPGTRPFHILSAESAIHPKAVLGHIA